MPRAIVPVRDIQRRLPEAGRLRIGVKTAKAMKAIDTWRVTSQDEEAVRQVAAIYGGNVQPWRDAPTPGQWEVITESSELQIVLPSDALGNGPAYELWSGGGCQRRCDGETCDVVGTGPEGPEMQQTECICSIKGAMECAPHLRLSVILPEIRFGGVWRLETKSWNAVAEIPGTCDLIYSMQERGLTRAILGLQHRKSVTLGQTHRFVVPVLRIADSLNAVASGAARFGSIGAGSSAPALPAGSVEGVGYAGRNDSTPVDEDGSPKNTGTAPSVDDDVVDAELVDDRSLADVLPADASSSRALAIARKLGSLATSVEDVHGYELIARVLDEMGLVGDAP